MLYPETLLNYLFSSRRFVVESLGFSPYKDMSSADRHYYVFLSCVGASIPSPCRGPGWDPQFSVEQQW